MIGRVLLTLTVLAVTIVLLVLIGLWDRYEKETAALGFSGIYERYLASQAGFADDAKAYRAVVASRRLPSWPFPLPRPQYSVSGYFFNPTFDLPNEKPEKSGYFLPLSNNARRSDD
jgi:hypothetical protein